MQGLADVTPDVPISPEKLAEAAAAELSDEAYAYVAGGAGGESTMDANRSAFDRWQLVPRMLRDVADRDLSVRLFGREYSAPVALAPIGALSIVHEEGDLGAARGAEAVDLPFVLSTVASHSIEDVAEDVPDARRWFQLYWHSDREITESFVERAERADYEAIVVTVDTPLLSWRERDVERAYLPFLDGDGIANYLTDSAFLDRLDHAPEANELAAIREFVDVFGDPSLTWDDLAWLREQTDLPLIVKGVLHPDDARAAVEAGADGVVVSNHGGRQVDRAVPALEQLPAVVDAVGDDATVLYDSGIRRGSDVLIALALGAEAVLLGRPYVYGLAIDGADGVEAVVKNFLADLDLTLGLVGYDDVADVDREAVVRASEL
jgi:isopentenyl diphosphate isomerase/L-lactate dehydrogenase-like FMN-dependent dehydrogenase